MSKISEMFGKTKQNRLGRDLNLLLWINILYNAASGLSSIFLNIFIFKASNLNTVIEFNIYSYIAIPFIFIFAGWMSKRVGHRINLILGMAISVVFYLFVILFRYSLVQYIPLIGMMKSVSLGFYYMAYNVLNYDFTDENNRDYFLGINGLTNSLTSMIFPVISGYIIWILPGITGYEVIFVLSFLLLLGGTFMSFAVPDKLSKESFKLLQMFKAGIVNKDLRNTLFSDILYGGRAVVVTIALSIFIFEIQKSESTVGNFSFWVYFAGTVGSYIGGRIIKPKNRHSYILLGSVLVAAVSSVFLYNINVLALYIFGVLNAVFDAWLYIPHVAVGYSVISQIPQSAEVRTEVLIVKEFAYLAGRMAALAAFMAVSARNDFVAVFFFILGVMQILRWVLLRKVGRIA